MSRPALTLKRLHAMNTCMQIAMELGFMDGGDLDGENYEDYKAAHAWVEEQITKRQRKAAAKRIP